MKVKFFDSLTERDFEVAYKKNVFKEGGASRLVRNLESEIKLKGGSI